MRKAAETIVTFLEDILEVRNSDPESSLMGKFTEKNKKDKTAQMHENFFFGGEGVVGGGRRYKKLQYPSIG